MKTYKLGELITQRREKNNETGLPIRGVSREGLIPPKQIDADTSIYNVFYLRDFIYNPARMELNSIAFNDKYEKANKPQAGTARRQPVRESAARKARMSPLRP